MSNLAQATAALTPMTETLAADGYILTVEPASAGLILNVSATPEACAECLVPKDLFRTMAEMALRDGGVAVNGDIEIIYPDAHHDS